METGVEANWSMRRVEAIYVSPTNHCNLHCPMCPNRRMTTPRGYLDWDMFERLVNELAELRGRPGAALSELHFANDGEPFLHPAYLDMLKYLDRRIENLRIFVSSNACLLDEAKIDQLLALRRNAYYLIFSLDASNPELYSRVRVGGDFAKAQSNVRYALERKRREDINNPYVVVQFVVMPENQNDRDAFYWQWEPYLGPVWKAAGFTWWEGQLQVNRAHVAWKEYTAGWGSHQVAPLKLDEHGEASGGNGAGRVCLHPQRPPAPGRICAWPWRRVSIGWDGGVGLCCWHWESLGLLGTLQSGSLRDVFEGERAAGFRHRFWTGQYDQLPVCGHCDRRDWWHDANLEAELATP